MRFFGKCIRENFSSPLVYIAALLFAVLCAAGVTVDTERVTYSFFEIISDPELLSTARTNPDCSSYIMAIKFTQSAWYPIGMAVLTAIPALYTYVRSLEKIHNFSLIRLNYKSYAAGVIFSSFIVGLVIAFAGLVIYFAATYMLFPSIGSFEDPMHEVIYGDARQRLLYMARTTLSHAAGGGVISVFAITLYRFIRSDFLAAVIPMMLMYISVKVDPNYYEWLSEDVNRSENIFARLLVILFPSNLPGLANTFEYSFGAPFWLAYIIFGALVFAMYFLFYRSIRNRT